MTPLRSRILLHRLPVLVGDVIESVLGTVDDVEVVQSADPDLGRAVAAGRAEAVIIGYDDADAIRDLLLARPRMRALAISGHGEWAVLYELQPRRAVLGELTTGETLVAALRPRPWSWVEAGDDR